MPFDMLAFDSLTFNDVHGNIKIKLAGTCYDYWLKLEILFVDELIFLIQTKSS
jgi:hypothetical protein